MMTTTGHYLATVDQELFTPPDNWDFSIYSLEPKTFWYSETKIPLFDGCEIIRYDFRSRVRFTAGLKNQGLQLSFIDSYSTNASRLQGMNKIDSILMITPGGYDWDALSDVGALGIDINLDDKTAAKILNDEALFRIKGMQNLFGASRSIVIKPSLSALHLKQFVIQLLTYFDRTHSIDFDKSYSEVNKKEIEAPQEICSIGAFDNETLLEMTSNVIDEIAPDTAISDRASTLPRRELALNIEKLLWQPPTTRESSHDLNLDEVSQYFGVSRRLVQQAIQEQFGMGFIALKRIIRLYQVRQTITKEIGFQYVYDLGSNHYFKHAGRLSNQYKSLFGTLPSHDNRIRKSII